MGAGGVDGDEQDRPERDRVAVAPADELARDRGDEVQGEDRHGEADAPDERERGEEAERHEDGQVPQVAQPDLEGGDRREGDREGDVSSGHVAEHGPT